MTVSVHAGQSQLQPARINGAGALLLAWLLSTMSLWFFAFYDMPGEAPDWVRRAQVACFGSDEYGMPGPSGWMLLILSPLLFLGAIILALGSEATSFFRSWHSGRFSRIGNLIILSAIVVESGWVTSAIWARLDVASNDTYKLANLSLPADYPLGHNKASDFLLVNQTGNNTSLSMLAGKPVLLSFVFAHCKAVCPTLVKTIQNTARKFAPGEIQVVLITLDPWRDTPASLPTLANKWQLESGQWVLSGEPSQVNAAIDAYTLPRQRDENSGDVVHPSIVHVINSEGELSYSFNSPSVEWLEEALRRIPKASKAE